MTSFIVGISRRIRVRNAAHCAIVTRGDERVFSSPVVVENGLSLLFTENVAGIHLNICHRFLRDVRHMVLRRPSNAAGGKMSIYTEAAWT